MSLDLRSGEHIKADIMHKREQSTMNNMLFKPRQVFIIMKWVKIRVTRIKNSTAHLEKEKKDLLPRMSLMVFLRRPGRRKAKCRARLCKSQCLRTCKFGKCSDVHIYLILELYD